MLIERWGGERGERERDGKRGRERELKRKQHLLVSLVVGQVL